MLIAPNLTVVVAEVRGVHPERDGMGATLELTVRANESSNTSADFLRPELGTTINVFCANPAGIAPFDHVRAELSLNSDAFGGRTVVRSFKKIFTPSASA